MVNPRNATQELTTQLKWVVKKDGTKVLMQAWHDWFRNRDIWVEVETEVEGEGGEQCQEEIEQDQKEKAPSQEEGLDTA